MVNKGVSVFDVIMGILVGVGMVIIIFGIIGDCCIIFLEVFGGVVVGVLVGWGLFIVGIVGGGLEELLIVFS